jgi:PKD repeat protein
MKKLFPFLFLFFCLHFAKAQCPIASNCTPGTAPSSAFPFGMGIYDVVIGTGTSGFNNTTPGAPDGYKDYSCTKKATVLEGAPTSIAVYTNQNVNENVRVWLDLNNNGIFDAASELIFSSNNARTHTGTFIIPVNATVIKNTVLRLRVSADSYSSLIPTPCSTPAYSQVEDYGITVVSNTNRPTIDFIVNNPITCSPTVQFTNQVQNGATTYLWDFGDGTTSMVANPSHTYSTPNTYTVKLKACNANGCDSLTKTNYVNYHTNVPIAASCTPLTTSYCCSYGITSFALHTMVNTSQDAVAGYEDFTCSKSVTVEENVSYPIEIITGYANPQDTWVYIDYNNNGIFETTELVFSSLNNINPTGNILIATGTVKNTPLRMRVIADAIGTATGPCANRTNGQAEDYTIITTANLRKPVAAYNSNFSNICDSLVQFTDISLNGPTSWLWDFGDGSPRSALSNPAHEYQNAGTYTVKLKVCNASGCDSLTKQNYISYRKTCPTYCIPSYNSNNALAITNVTLNTINNSTGAEPNAYGDYTIISTTLVKGNYYTVTSSRNWGWSTYTSVYIDLNQDGDFFDPNERVATGGGLGTFTRSFMIPTTAKSGVTRMRVMASGTAFTSCTNGQYQLETEDYSVNIIPNNQKPTALFFTYNRNYCSYTIAFTDTSGNSPTSWRWNFDDPASGAANISTLQNPRHTFSGPGTYAIKLTSCNSFGCDSLLKTGYVTITGNNAPQGISCKPITYFPSSGSGISNVTFNSINNTTPINNSYQDYACSLSTMVNAGQTYPISVRDGVNSLSDLRVWIDYNNDGSFNNTSELAFSSSFQTLHTGTITIPSSSVQNIPLRMRVASESNSNFYPPRPCTNIQSGQVEDYSIIVVNPLSIKENTLAQSYSIYPNPNNGAFYFKNTTISKGPINLKIYNTVGLVVAEKQMQADKEEHLIDLKYLPKGIYLVKVLTAGLSETRKLLIE